MSTLFEQSSDACFHWHNICFFASADLNLEAFYVVVYTSRARVVSYIVGAFNFPLSKIFRESHDSSFYSFVILAPVKQENKGQCVETQKLDGLEWKSAVQA